MNYILLINWFWEDVPYRPGYKDSYGLTFLAIVDLCNRNSWRKTKCEYDRMINRLKIGKRMYYESIRWLVSQGLVEYSPGKNEYAMAEFSIGVEVQKCTATDTSTAPLQHLSSTATDTSTAPSIINIETNKPLNNKPSNVEVLPSETSDDLPPAVEESDLAIPQKKEEPLTPDSARPPLPDKPPEEKPPTRTGRKPQKENADKAHLFRDSKYFDEEQFVDAFEEKYQIYDLPFYYEKVKNWSDSANAKKVDWIATARNFMLGDVEKGKAKLRPDLQQHNGSQQAKPTYNGRRYPERESPEEFGATINALADWKYGK